MYCRNCGKQVSEGAKFCENCGASLLDSCKNNTPMQGNSTCNNNVQNNNSFDAESSGIVVVGALFPVIGLILYLIWKDEKPLRAYSASKGALIGVFICIGLGMLSFFLSYAYVSGRF